MFVENRRFGAAAIAAFLAAAAAAQDAPASAESRRAEAERRAFEDLETTFITATRTNLRREASPQQSFELSGDVLIEEDLARTFADSFRRLPGTLVQKTSASQSSPYLRGFTGYHTLLMMDGVRLNDSTLRSGPNDLWSTVDAYSVGEAEIVFGPSSVLYGSDAVGGAVNVIPKHRTRFGEGWDWDRRVIFRGATGERSLSFRVENEGNVGDDFGFFVGATYQPFGRIDGGGSTGPQPTTGYENLGGDAVFDVRFDQNWSLRLTAQSFDVSDGWRTHSTIFGAPFAGSTIGTDQRRVLDFRRDLLAATVEGRDLGGFVDGARFQLSYKGYAEREDRIAGSGARTWQGFDVDTFGAAFHLISETGLGTFTYGADWYHDDVDSFRHNFNAAGVQTASSVQGPVGDDAKYDLVGAFVQDEIRATDELSVI
ncbi:MAG TPA: TonB-dependent receptor plug domain-containing protein, partial [Planctomycetota bacterium]|nr:TonB-dependent receptor plug domain-containing protein [Planctomycetota bacterium]